MIQSDNRRLAQSGDQSHRVWVIIYEDADMSTAVFTGPDAEKEAREQYERSKIGWNCYLMCTAYEEA
ncbi:hypothetical protein EVB64_154 [Rhizobium phage RHph_TM61]|nr:hypothetical protein EVB64_154 [Rhizobium phage RHph_TM61]